MKEKQRSLSREDLPTDTTEQRAVERMFENAIQACSDLAQHVATHNWLASTAGWTTARCTKPFGPGWKSTTRSVARSRSGSVTDTEPVPPTTENPAIRLPDLDPRWNR
ncbi:HepT-like ribonuclease domain-containing protein [Halomarina halobia]|uniref:HepT-like ribonuclease domain-containing protein n=1 Tax=Halomarina halobia TaxID=3033386 RepID=UPI0023E7C8EC|nr:HepT-like ribonuclease domain-containing protein [Halomarina sp. PSR21]